MYEVNCVSGHKYFLRELDYYDKTIIEDMTTEDGMIGANYSSYIALSIFLSVEGWNLKDPKTGNDYLIPQNKITLQKLPRINLVMYQEFMKVFPILDRGEVYEKIREINKLTETEKNASSGQSAAISDSEKTGTEIQ